MAGDTSEDWRWAVESVCNLTDTAASNQVTLVMEPLNRYESCVVNTAEDVLRFVTEVNHPNVRALLDTYHMNIEESDVGKAFHIVKDCVEVVHFADSNRRALGQGHIDFRPVVAGMKAIGFDKTIVLECTAPGPDPFRADKGDTTAQTMAKYAKGSLAKLKEYRARSRVEKALDSNMKNQKDAESKNWNFGCRLYRKGAHREFEE